MRHLCLHGQMDRIGKGWGCLVWLGMMLFLFQLPGAAEGSGNETSASKTELAEIEKKWGIEVLPVRLTATGRMLDYRYRVIDPEKAMGFMRRGEEGYLIEQASGTKIPVAQTKIGPMRQTGSKPRKGAVYPVLFTNIGRTVKAGSKVTVVLGEFRVENLVVESQDAHTSELPQPKQAQWEAVQKTLRRELGTCSADCGQERTCFEQCEEVYRSRLDKEYLKISLEN